MQKSFVNWVLGIIEDDPIPYEIDCIFFNIHRNSFYFYLSMGGNENKISESFDYFPLEAQFFDIKKFNSFITLANIKSLVEKSLHNKLFKQVFNNKKIFVHVFGEKDYFLIENN